MDAPPLLDEPPFDEPPDDFLLEETLLDVLLAELLDGENRLLTVPVLLLVVLLLVDAEDVALVLLVRPVLLLRTVLVFTVPVFLLGEEERVVDTDLAVDELTR